MSNKKKYRPAARFTEAEAIAAVKRDVAARFSEDPIVTWDGQPASQPAIPGVKSMISGPEGLRATLDDGRVITVMIDLADVLDIMDNIEELEKLDADTDAYQQVRLMRRVIPASYLEQVRGVNPGTALRIFMRYVGSVGDQMGKALDS